MMHKSKTMWFAFALVVLGFIAENFNYVQDIIDPKYYGISYMTIGVVVAILRFITTQPISEK